jgi:hypothetical protein
MNEMIREEDLVAVAPELSSEQRQQVLMIAIGLERDFISPLAITFAAADKLRIEPHIVATAISLNALLLAASLHGGSEASFIRMATQSLALFRSGKEVQ